MDSELEYKLEGSDAPCHLDSKAIHAISGERITDIPVIGDMLTLAGPEPMRSHRSALLENLESDMYEPQRRILSTTPPKRFYRAFWRAMTHRILEHAQDRSQ